MQLLITLKKRWKKYLLTSLIIFLGVFLLSALAPTTLDDFFMPGSQPGQSGNIETPQKCDNCHGGYDLAVEPAFNWRGSMMSQAARDPLFYACMAIANQDAPDAGDLCIRCHSPAGWLEGRSVPTDGTALNNNDRESVQCDFCHKLIKPTPLGVNPFPDDADYTAGTYQDDQTYLATLGNNIPPQDGNGMYVAHSGNAKRGPFVDANAKHQMRYSPFHKTAAICGTCHDVSNPVYERQPDGSYLPNEFGTISNTFHTYEMFPVERTYSEWLNSAYNTPQGVYAPQFGGNKDYVSTCQDCHMKDVSGYGCNKNGVPLRHDLPLHDMTGGNTFIPILVQQLYPEEVDPAALSAGIERARYMLQNAATMNVSCVQNQSTGNYLVNVEVINETGHKLPSGYPEGRRMWINVKAFDASGSLAYESGAYDFNTAVLTHDDDVKIYEIKPGIGDNLASTFGLPAAPSFHFAINNHIYFDNRIPPRGFNNAVFEYIQSPPVGYSYDDGQYWDNTQYEIDGNISLASIEVTLYYQTLSKEYVDFLKAENHTNDAGNVLHNLWASNGKSAPEEMEHVILNIGPPIADFNAEPGSGYAPLEVQFTDYSTNGPSSWTWNFDDGTTSTIQNPVHEFTVPGTYTVTLMVSNDFGTSAPYSETITVIDPPATPQIFVENMVVGRITLGGNRKAGLCEVTVKDNAGNLVPGASVSVDYTGPTSGSANGATNSNGVAAIESRATKNATDIWCFTVTDIVASGYEYNAGMNVVSSACETAKSYALDEYDARFEIKQIFPNPFTSRTVLEINLQSDINLNIIVYNHFGQKVALLADGIQQQGISTIEWDASAQPSGIYFIRVQAGAEQMIYKVVKR